MCLYAETLELLPPDWEYNLPTDAQWEYACRAGTTSRFYFGDNPREFADYGWSAENSARAGGSDVEAHPVGQKKPNAWGIHDMLGNLSEWRRDYYGSKLPGGVDPLGPVGNDEERRVSRGGDFTASVQYNCDSASRGAVEHDWEGFTVGFRVALVRSTE